MRRALLVAFSLLSLTGAACSGVDTTQEAATTTPTPDGDDGDGPGPGPGPSNTATPTPTPNPTSTPSGSTVMETEDNGTLDTANDLGGSGAKSFAGACADDLDDDGFKFTAAAGAFTASVTWNEANGDDVDLWLLDDAGVLVADDEIPPGDSPAQVTFQLPAAGTYYLGVICYGPNTNVPYTGSANVP